jgi:hypothetical protein
VAAFERGEIAGPLGARALVETGDGKAAKSQGQPERLLDEQ